MAAKKMLDLRDRRARFRMGRTSGITGRPDTQLTHGSGRLHERRRRVRIIIACVAVLAIGAGSVGVTWLSHMPQFSISTVTVVGAHEVSAQSVEDHVRSILDDPTWHYLSQKNIFFYDRGAIERGLIHDFPRIETAHLSRPSLLSQALVVTLTERQSIALWCAEGGACYEMDGAGFIFAEASTTAATSSNIFEGGAATSSPLIGQTFAYGHMQGLLALLEGLREAGFATAGVTVESNEDLAVHLAEGYDLKVSFGEDPDVLVQNLQLVLGSDALKGHESDLAYIDLRFGNRVYYKMNGSSDAKVVSQ